MFRRSNPWPAFTDLFACLFIGTLGGFLLLAGTLAKNNKELEETNKELEETKEKYVQAVQRESRLNAKVAEIVDRITRQLDSTELKAKHRICGNDVCLDLDIHFELNSDVIAQPDELTALRKTCRALESTWGELQGVDRDNLELVIEGHSDDQIPLKFPSAAQNWRYNWDLSSRRAVSVLYQFEKCGVKRPTFHVVAAGFADSDRKCKAPVPSAECRQENRRTTLRFRVNTQRLQQDSEVSNIDVKADQ